MFTFFIVVGETGFLFEKFSVCNLFNNILLLNYYYCYFSRARFSLSFLGVGDVAHGNESFVDGCSFNDGYNVGIGVYGTNDLTVKNNVIYRTVGQGIDLEGSRNKLLNNLVVYSVAEATFRVWRFVLFFVFFSVFIDES